MVSEADADLTGQRLDKFKFSLPLESADYICILVAFIFDVES